MISTRPLHPSTLRAGLAVAAAALLLASCQTATPVQSPREFETQWHDLLARRDYAAAAKLIDQRDKRLPDDPEVTIARANLYFRRAVGAGAGFGTSGRPPGSPRDSAGLDTLLVRRALDTLHDGIARHPGRLDMRLGLVYLCQQLGMRDAEAQLIGETVAYARQHPDSLRWSYGEPLPRPADEFVPQSLHEYVRYYADHGAPGDDRWLLALAEIVMQAYPNSAFIPNDLAYFFGAKGDWQTSLGFLRRAERADSSDALVLYNLGWAHEQLKQRDIALRYYRRALTAGSAGGNGEIVASASQRLGVLGAKP
jgi:tetratricopeptide (TPR) repeat protein